MSVGGLYAPPPFTLTAAEIIAAFGPQTANNVFAGPTMGAAAAPSFRLLVSADIAGLVVNGSVAAGNLPIPFILAGLPQPVAAGASDFFPIAGSIGGLFTSDGNSQVRSPRAGTLKRLRVRVTANATTTASTLAIRINGVDSAVSISIGAGLTGTFTDDVDSAAVALNDLLNYHITAGAVGSITLSVIQCDLTF